MNKEPAPDREPQPSQEDWGLQLATSGAALYLDRLANVDPKDHDSGAVQGLSARACAQLARTYEREEEIKAMRSFVRVAKDGSEKPVS